MAGTTERSITDALIRNLSQKCKVCFTECAGLCKTEFTTLLNVVSDFRSFDKIQVSL